MNLGAKARQLDDLQGSAGNGGSGNRSRFLGSQSACGEDLQLNVSFFYDCRGDIYFARQRTGLAAGDAAGRESQQRQKNPGMVDALFHRVLAGCGSHMLPLGACTFRFW